LIVQPKDEAKSNKNDEKDIIIVSINQFKNANNEQLNKNTTTILKSKSQINLRNEYEEK